MYLKAELDIEENDPITYATFQGDFDALVANDDIEVKRVMFYNYLLSIGMPVTSDITVWKGE